jgi:hypothetical protein
VQSATDSVPSTAPVLADTYGDFPVPDDEALDAFARVLRALGQHSFDLEHESAITFSQLCEAWARHLLILAPPPTDGASPRNGVPPRYSDTRDWSTVLRFVQSRRQREQQHVNKALGDLRQGIWAFAQSLGTVLVEDQRVDDRMKAQIDRLKAAVERQSTEDCSCATSSARLPRC